MIQIKTIDLQFQGLISAVAVYLITSSEGHILIETGPYSTFTHLEAELSKMKIKIEDIGHVFLTHIHLDHGGAAWAFAEKGVNIYLHPFGAKHMEDPSKLMASARMIYKEHMDELWGEMRPISAKQLIEVGHEEIIRIGKIEIKSHHTPGHARHHIAWQIADMLFVGDVAGVKIGNGPIQPPCPPPDISIEDWKNSIKLIKQLNVKKLYLAHFDQITDINEHLDQLEYKLDDWSQFIKTHWLKGLSNEEIVPLFVAYSKQQLMEAGLGESSIQQYMAANPSWMSVAGLTRYWTKKTQV